MPDTSTPFSGSNSIAEDLKKAGFRKTGIARAVAELVGEYLGIHANLSADLKIALGNTNNVALQVLDKPESVTPVPGAPVVVTKGTESAIDPYFSQPKTGTNG